MNYAIVVSTCAGMWAHVIGDTVRFESLDPPLISFTGRTRYTLSAFGEHLISEEVEAAIARAASATGAAVRDWHVGPVFAGAAGVSPVRRRVPRGAGRSRAVSATLSTPTFRGATPIIGPTAPGRGAAAAGGHRRAAGQLRGLDAAARQARRPEQGAADGQFRDAHAGAR